VEDHLPLVRSSRRYGLLCKDALEDVSGRIPELSEAIEISSNENSETVLKAPLI
jgi:hypothetical protein